MAENDQKTHDPTAKRLEDARKKGDLPSAPEMRHAMVFAAMLVALGGTGIHAFSQMATMLVRLWGSAEDFPLSPDGAQSVATGLVAQLAIVFAPIVGARMSKADPRRLVFIGLIWLGFITALRCFVTNDVTYWQISIPLMLMGFGLPFFFVPLTALSLGSVEPRELASAAGIQNFLRTLSGAVATSVVQTIWEDRTAYNHSELSGLTDRNGDAMRAFEGMGMSHDQALYALNNMVDEQSVMIATNQVMAMVTIAFFIAASVIWLAPKPTRAVSMAEAGH